MISKHVKLLSFSFFFIFLGFGGVEEYVTSFFSEKGLVDLGFNSLILIYLFFILFNPLSAVCVSKYGTKKCMLLSAIFYSLFIISLLSGSEFIVYLASSLLGISAAFLWTAQTTYLIRMSNKKYYGANSGFFNTFQSVGSAIGAFSLGVIISLYSFETSFLMFSIFPLMGFLLMLRLKDIKAPKKSDNFGLIRKALSSKTSLRLTTMGFAANFIYGLIIGVIPLEIKGVLGVLYIGVLLSLFYIMPIILSYFFGNLSDLRGRVSMIVLSYALLAAGLIFLSYSGTAIFLVGGIVLLAISWAILMPVTFALIGDVTTKKNLVFFSALFWMVENIGILSALLLSNIFKSDPRTIYAVSIFVLFASLMVLLPLLRLRISKIKGKISREIC